MLKDNKWFLLAIVALACFMFLFRYEPAGIYNGTLPLVLDHFTGKMYSSVLRRGPEK